MVLSKLPPLGGNFPLTTTLTLRLCNLMEGSNYAPVAVDAVKSLLTLPQVSFGSPSDRDQLLHHMRFSLDYLRRFKLLDRECRPMNLYGLVSHLYYTEPMNLALVALMRAGVFHKICNQGSSIDAQHDLIHLLAHLFGRRYLPRSYSTDKDIKLLVKNSPSKVILPPLPKWILAILKQSDRETVRIFSTYAKTYTKQHVDKLGKDCALPLSGDIETGKVSEVSSFYRHLEETAIPVTTRSVFAATSGLTDYFGSVEELSSSSRNGLNLHIQTIPSFKELYTNPAKDGGYFAVNAYILDFYTHGQVLPLIRANGIRRGDLWYLLQDFDLILATIKASLEQLFTELSASVDPTDIDNVPVLDTADPESDDEDSNSTGAGNPTTFKRPTGIKNEDWRVYITICSAAMTFREKFKEMWA
jgi:ATP-dependent RNA helicase DDX60